MSISQKARLKIDEALFDLSAELIDQEDAQRVIEETLLEEQVRAVNEIADSWQWGQWANAPRMADPIQERIANAQFTTDWLRAKARELKTKGND